MVLHGNSQERLGTVARACIELSRPGKIEIGLRVGVRNVDRLRVNGRVGRHQRIIGLALRVVQRKVGEINRPAGASAHGKLKGVRPEYLETKGLAILSHAVQRAAIGMGDGLGSHENALQQPCDVALLGERRANGVELFEPTQQVFNGVHYSPLHEKPRPRGERPILPQSPAAHRRPTQHHFFSRTLSTL